MKRLLCVVIALVMLVALAVPAMAADGTKVYLKGTGKDFTENWNNVFTLGGAEEHGDPSVWHLVFTGKNMSAVTAMQLDFGENGVWEWTPDMGFSVNGGGKNPGWVVVAPADWEIVYVNKGNKNNSDSFVVTTEKGNPQFNISGFHQGTPEEGSLDTFIYINKFVNGFGPGFEGAGFEFDVFPAEGPFDAPLATLTTDELGYAEFTFAPALAEGDYIVRERVPAGFAPVKPLKFTVDADGIAEFEDGVNTVTNWSLGALEVTDDVVEEYYEEYHKPVYKPFNHSGTLSSVSDTIAIGENWFRYVKLDMNQVYGDGQVVEIASSSDKKSIEGIGYYYTVRANENGELVVSFNGELISASLIARAYLDVPNPGNNGGHVGLATGGTLAATNGNDRKSTFTIPAGATDVYLYVHFQQLSYYELDENGERIVIDCEFDEQKGPFERLFPGEVTMTVVDSEGAEAYTGPLGLVEDLMFGDYTVTIYVDGVELASKVVTVVSGQTTNADFGKLMVPTPGANVIICGFCNP